jgi:hypothetical protein
MQRKLQATKMTGNGNDMRWKWQTAEIVEARFCLLQYACVPLSTALRACQCGSGVGLWTTKPHQAFASSQALDTPPYQRTINLRRNPPFLQFNRT